MLRQIIPTPAFELLQARQPASRLRVVAELRSETTEAGQRDELRFREFILLPRSRALLRRCEPVQIGGRAFDLLHILCRHRGRVVSHADIISGVWPDMFVDESNLRFQIGCLRKVLGEHRDLVKSIPGRGYLLAGDDMQEIGGSPEGRGRMLTPQSTPPRALVARIDGSSHELIEDLVYQLSDIIERLRILANLSDAAVWSCSAEPQP